MSNADYLLIAETLLPIKKSIENDRRGMISHDEAIGAGSTYNDVLMRLSAAFSRNDPQFEARKFLKACGSEEWLINNYPPERSQNVSSKNSN